MNETLTTNSDPCSETGKALASESTHWYHCDGRPCYEVEAKKGGMRATTIADARKLDLVPSVTAILNIAAKPGLEAWKAKQILESALTLPQLSNETLDDYAVRVIEDSKAQSRKAMERGTELHAAIEGYIQTREVADKWASHAVMIRSVLEQHGVSIFEGKAEHSFACDLGFGGKVDFHSDTVVLDFKTKDRLQGRKQLAWPEQCWQLSAYSYGLHMLNSKCRILNVFIGIEDVSVRVHEWTPEDAVIGWEVFSHLLAVWKITKKYNP